MQGWPRPNFGHTWSMFCWKRNQGTCFVSEKRHVLDRLNLHQGLPPRLWMGSFLTGRRPHLATTSCCCNYCLLHRMTSHQQQPLLATTHCFQHHRHGQPTSTPATAMASRPIAPAHHRFPTANNPKKEKKKLPPGTLFAGLAKLEAGYLEP